MRKIISVLAIGAALSACSDLHRTENFDEFFLQMQQDAKFRSARMSTELTITEEITWNQGNSISRDIQCHPTEIEAFGWELIPGADRLRETGTVYASPRIQSNGEIVLSLGPLNGKPDAEYTFTPKAGEWHLTRLKVLTSLDATDPLPPYPCQSSGHRPNNSFKPNPLRGSA